MIDLDLYYAPDHAGHRWLSELLRYANTHRRFLTDDECQYIADYYECVKGLIDNRTLHLQENCPWDRLNYRYGWNSVRGTQAEILAIIIWNRFSSKTKFRLTAELKEEQERGKDLAAVNPRWRFEYVVQVKLLTRGNDPKQMYIDPTRIFKYEPTYVDRLVFVDPDNQTLIHLNYSAFKTHYEKCDKYYGGYIDEKFSSIKNYYKFTL